MPSSTIHILVATHLIKDLYIAWILSQSHYYLISSILNSDTHLILCLFELVFPQSPKHL